MEHYKAVIVKEKGIISYRSKIETVLNSEYSKGYELKSTVHLDEGILLVLGKMNLT